MKKYLVVKDGIEEGINQLVLIERGMEIELQNTIDHLVDCKADISITYGAMTDELYAENEIEGVMYTECCNRQEAIEIINGWVKTEE